MTKQGKLGARYANHCTSMILTKLIFSGKEEIMEVRSEGGDNALCTICDMHGIEVSALETLLWHAFE